MNKDSTSASVSKKASSKAKNSSYGNTYTYDNVKKVFKNYYKRHPKANRLPNPEDIIEEEPLANGTRKWGTLLAAFPNRAIKGVTITSAGKFVAQEGLLTKQPQYLHTRKNVYKAIRDHFKANPKSEQLPYEEIIQGNSPLANGKRKYKELATPFCTNRVLGVPYGTSLGVFLHEEFGKKAPYTKRARLNLDSVFNSVAWQILTTGREPGATKTPVSHGLLAIGLDPADRLPWDNIALWCEQGLIPQIPKGVKFSAFTAEVKNRLKQGNFQVPNSLQMRRLVAESASLAVA